MRAILNEHARRYPQWEVDDLYKLILQAAMCSEHDMGDETSLRDRLLQELAQLGPGPGEPLVDPISPDGRIVRVHLRPFTILQSPLEPLLQAYIRTSREVSPSPERLEEYAAVAILLAGEGMLPFSRGLVANFMADMRARNFPAVHHSVRYRQLYQPAYRVVLRDLLPKEVIAAADPARPNRHQHPARTRKNQFIPCVA
jgi:hypothetical protein